MLEPFLPLVSHKKRCVEVNVPKKKVTSMHSTSMIHTQGWVGLNNKKCGLGVKEQCGEQKKAFSVLIHLGGNCGKCVQH